MTEPSTTITRRQALALAPIAAAAHVLLAGRAAQAQQKAEQKMVQYQDKPKNNQECDKCLHFEPPAGCKLVAGKINPKGWCQLFAPKPAAPAKK